MIYLIIISSLVLLGSIAVFVSVNSNHSKEININNQRLDKMFEFLRDDIAKVNIQVKELKQEIEAVQQMQLANSKRIEALENQIAQLRTGANSRFY
jgi:peptidoglycan hydrolase CwlO-like protein